MFGLVIPRHQRRDTWLAAVYGGMLLAWFSSESNSIHLVSFLGAGLAAGVVYLGLLSRMPDKKISPVGIIFLCALTGLLAMGCVIFLMIFKNSWHAHAAPDFSGEVITQMITRTPAWIITGGVLGGAVVCWKAALSGGTENAHPDHYGSEDA